MSLLKVNAVSDVLGTQQGNVADIVRGYAKAWVSFSGTGTVTINRAFNVTSITDLGTGSYRVNMTTAMGSVNYSVVIGIGRIDAIGGYDASTKAADAFTINTRTGSNTNSDTADVSAAVFY